MEALGLRQGEWASLGILCNEIDLKQSRLSTHSQYSVKILNIAQNGYYVIITERIIHEIRHGDIPHNYVSNDICLVLLYPQDWRKYYRLKSVYFFKQPVYCFINMYIQLKYTHVWYCDTQFLIIVYSVKIYTCLILWYPVYNHCIFS